MLINPYPCYLGFSDFPKNALFTAVHISVNKEKGTSRFHKATVISKISK